MRPRVRIVRQATQPREACRAPRREAATTSSCGDSSPASNLGRSISSGFWASVMTAALLRAKSAYFWRTSSRCSAAGDSPSRNTRLFDHLNWGSSWLRLRNAINRRLHDFGVDLAQEQNVFRTSELLLCDHRRRQVLVECDQPLVHFTDAIVPVQILIEFSRGDLRLQVHQGLGDLLRLRRAAIDADAAGDGEVVNVLDRIGIGRDFRQNVVEELDVGRSEHGDHAGKLEIDVRIAGRKKLRDPDTGRDRVRVRAPPGRGGSYIPRTWGRSHGRVRNRRARSPSRGVPRV